SNSGTVAVGGGINNLNVLALVNSTVSGNSSGQDGGGIWNGPTSTVNLFNATITNNRADADFNGSGIGGGVFNNGGIAHVQNTIIADNEATRFDVVLGTWVSVFRDCAGAFTFTGNNLIRSAGNCTVNGNAPTIAIPVLGPLQNNGGATQTHALLPGSPAIGGGDPSGCRDPLGSLLTTDQRGFPRPAAGCAIGAFEVFSGSTSVVAALLPSSRSVQVGDIATAFATVINVGQAIAAGCSITPITNVPGAFGYQITEPGTNQ